MGTCTERFNNENFSNQGSSFAPPNQPFMNKGQDEQPTESVRKFHSFKNLQFEFIRLATFKDWPLKTPTPEDLARDGFFYTKKKDLVQCNYCRGVVGMWEPDDVPSYEHAKHYPNCPFVLKRPVTSIDDTQTDIVKSIKRKIETVEAPRHKKSMLADSVVKHKKVKVPDYFPEFSQSEKRLRTFIEAPANIPKADKMVEAGFFMLGLADMTQCFSCGGGVFNWASTEDPKAVHDKLYPNCRLSESDPDTNESANEVEYDSVKTENQTSLGVTAESFIRLPLAKKLIATGWTAELVGESFLDHFDKYGTIATNIGEAIDIVSDYEEMMLENN